MANRYSLSGDRRRSPLRSVFKVIVEFIVIVVGIYIAFQLENIRERDKTQELEQKYLEQLLEEAKINQRELKADQDAREEQVIYMKALLGASNRQVSADTLRRAVGVLAMARLYSPTDAVYQDLVSSGNLGIIKSDSVKNVLLNYRRALSRVPQTESSDVQTITDKIEPYLIDKRVLSLLEVHDDLDEIQISNQQIDRIIRVLLNDRTFIDLVYLRISRVQDVIYFERPMEWHLRNMIRLLENEIANLEN